MIFPFANLNNFINYKPSDCFDLYLQKINNKNTPEYYNSNEHKFEFYVIPSLTNLCSLQLDNVESNKLKNNFEIELENKIDRCCNKYYINKICKKHNTCLKCCFKNDINKLMKKTNGSLFISVSAFIKSQFNLNIAEKMILNNLLIGVNGDPGYLGWKFITTN